MANSVFTAAERLLIAQILAFIVYHGFFSTDKHVALLFGIEE
jgi:hypothetical protein